MGVKVTDEKIIEAVLSSDTQIEAAKKLKITPQTLSKRLHQQRLKEKLSEYRKDILDTTSNQLIKSNLLATETLTTLLSSESEYTRAISEINSVFREVRAKLANCTKLHSADLAENQVKNAIGFFNGEYPIKLTVDDINAFIDEFQSNFTMLRIIGDYIDKNFADDVTTTATLKTKIPSPRALCEKYKAICQSAINQIGAIHGNPSTGISRILCKLQNGNIILMIF